MFLSLEKEMTTMIKFGEVLTAELRAMREDTDYFNSLWPSFPFRWQLATTAANPNGAIGIATKLFQRLQGLEPEPDEAGRCNDTMLRELTLWFVQHQGRHDSVQDMVEKFLSEFNVSRKGDVK